MTHRPSPVGTEPIPRERSRAPDRQRRGDRSSVSFGAVVVITVAVALTCGVVMAVVGARDKTKTAAGGLSGLGWDSGAYVPGSDPVQYQRFADWRGRPLDVVVDWPARHTWSDIIDPAWLYRAWSGSPLTKVFGVGMIPDDGAATMTGCAAGEYDARWRQFGTNIAAAGLADSTIIRLGWEFNTDAYRWSATDPQVYAACWRHVVTSAESTAPGLRWEWAVNRGPGATLPDPRAAYPGDDYVDIVGVDAYDVWPTAHTEADWAVQYSGPYGLKFWADFAAAHAKKLSVPEWGTVSGTLDDAGHTDGDNPFYVDHMVQFFRSLGTALAYEAYFNQGDSECGCAIYDPVLNPRAATAYRSALASQ
jgi:hypothetical protein